MKLSPYVKSVRQAYQTNKLLLDDVLNLYKEGYLDTKECQQVINEGGKHGIRQLRK